ncbi:MAG TPA: lactate utilization protein [Desulfuromonadales bacterium]|nr:lactate utilization protein [Desulfuromonadales bacterium]
MVDVAQVEKFVEVARKVGAQVTTVSTAEEAMAYIRDRVQGPVVLPPFASGIRLELGKRLREAGCEVGEQELRQVAPLADAGVTGANFALADTGSVVLESTDEAIRLATTLPERHFVLLDPAKVLADGFAAVPYLRRFREKSPRHFLAYITGPSRTADIERVLTIGVHGPKELHILLMEGLSSDFLEM